MRNEKISLLKPYTVFDEIKDMSIDELTDLICEVYIEMQLNTLIDGKTTVSLNRTELKRKVKKLLEQKNKSEVSGK